MTDPRPSLDGATLHFLRTEGPRGFLMQFALVYAAGPRSAITSMGRQPSK